MVQIGIDSVAELGLVGLVVKFKRLSVVFFCDSIPYFGVIVIVALVVDHLDLIVHQPHGTDLLLQLEFHVSILEVLGFCQLRNEDIDRIWILIELEHPIVQFFLFLKQRRLLIWLIAQRCFFGALAQHHFPAHFFLGCYDHGRLLFLALRLPHSPPIHQIYTNHTLSLSAA